MLGDPKTFVEELAGKIAPLERRLCSLYWALATTGDEKVAKDLVEVEKGLKLLLSNPEEFRQLKKWKSDGIADPLLSRQVDLLIFDCTPNQLDEATIADLVERQTEIENIYNNFRSRMEGKEWTNNDLKEVLKKEKDNARREACWEAMRQIGKEVSGLVVELARRRNKAALTLGFKNHFEMSLTLQELDEGWLMRLFAGLKQASEKVFREKIGLLHRKLAGLYGVEADAVMPWHYDDPFAQQAPAQATIDLDPFLADKDILKIAREFYAGIDLDISDVLERSDLFERPKKSQHAFCITMDRGRDVRVLANLRPNGYWASTMLHELGHAAYSKNIAPELPYLLRDEAHTFATEAIAMLMERMVHHPDWLARMAIMPGSEAERLRGDLRDSLALDKLIIARWVMLVTNFEKGLYGNPDQDLNGLWWRLMKEYQLLEKPKGRDFPDWAAKIHIASHPVYYQNYLLGELMAAQIAETLEKEAIGKPLTQASFHGVSKIGALLKERLFQTGCQWPWTKLVGHVTGQPLSGKSFIAQFCSR